MILTRQNGRTIEANVCWRNGLFDTHTCLFAPVTPRNRTRLARDIRTRTAVTMHRVFATNAVLRLSFAGKNGRTVPTDVFGTNRLFDVSNRLARGPKAPAIEIVERGFAEKPNLSPYPLQFCAHGFSALTMSAPTDGSQP
jgi:hypothetical protein